MKLDNETFTGAAGIPIVVHRWEPDVSAKAVVVVAHGFGEHALRYTNLVEALLPRAYCVIAPDHRGHGLSGGKRAYIDRHAYLLDDMDQVFRRAGEIHPSLPVFLVGHSMGGNIALGSALRSQSHLRGLVLSGPAVSTHGVSRGLRLAAKVLGRLTPTLGVKQLSSDAISRDPAVVAAYVGDPLVFHAKMPAGTGAALLSSSEHYATMLHTLSVPLLVVHGSEDKLVSVESGKAAHRLAGSADKTIKIYDGLYHEVFNEPEHPAVLADMADWLDAH